jgi:hypothetical protein
MPPMKRLTSEFVMNFQTDLKNIAIPIGVVPMSRVELLQAAIIKLEEAACLLTEAGEERLALEATELKEWVDFSIPVPPSRAA